MLPSDEDDAPLHEAQEGWKRVAQAKAFAMFDAIIGCRNMTRRRLAAMEPKEVSELLVKDNPGERLIIHEKTLLAHLIEYAGRRNTTGATGVV